jgi:TctA family transporter
VGYITGLMPGTAGGIGDWVAYALVASQNKKDKIKFGEGNIKGVIGSEGANNSGKMGALLPTIIFGIPGNKMYAILMALWIYVGFEVGDLSVMEDTKFLTHLFGGYMVGTVIAGILMIVLARYLSRLMEVKLAYWMVPLGLLIIWSILSSRHYVTVQEDLILLTVFSYIGYLCKSFKFSRPALLMAYVLFEKLEGTFYMMKGIYFINNDVWLEHPLMTIFFILSVLILFYGRKVTMNYN